jgi:hypothetical protein
MYCMTTNTLCTAENNVRYSALTYWLIYHEAWFRTVPFTSELYTYWKENSRMIRAWKIDRARWDTTTTCSIWLASSTTMIIIDRYKQYPGSISCGKHRQVPTYKGGKVTEVVIYANYIGLRRFYRYVVNIGRWSPYEGGQLDRFHCI